MANYNLSLPAETIDSLLLWLDDKQGIIIKQTDLLSGTGQSTTATMTQKAITDALGAKADASSVYTKTQADTLLDLKADKSTTYTKTETDTLLGGKVDKEVGKGLSSNDYTDAEKAKLGALPTAAELSTDLAAKQDKDTDAVAGNVAVMDGNGNSVDGGVALTDLATKAEVAQIAGEAGLAEAVIDTDGAGTEQEFTFRKSGGDGGAFYRKIKGRTLAWNQLFYGDNFSRSLNGVDITIQNGHLVGSGTPNISTTSSLLTSSYAQPLIVGHKYYVHYSGSHSGCNLRFYRGASYPNDDLTESIIITADGTNDANFTLLTVSGQAIVLDCYLFFIDLTLLYGSALDGKTDTEILAMYEADFGMGYYPQNPGTLISNDAEAVETTGVNQWDEVVSTKTISSTTGEQTGEDNLCISSLNHIPVQPSTTYFVKCIYGHGSGTAGLYIKQFDGKLNPLSSDWDFPNVKDYTITTSPNARYIKFMTIAAYGTTYNHDICINLSNPAINGQYFPYWKRDLQLNITTRKDTDGNVPFADGMKGVGTVQDWCDKVGGEKRMMRVNLGNLSWQRIASGSGYYFYGALPGIKYLDDASAIPNVICPVFMADTWNNVSAQVNDNTVAVFFNAGLRIVCNTYTNAAAFKAAMDGVMLDFELATPVPFTWAEPLNLGVKVDENGTERAVAPEGATAPSAPFVADTTYTMSVARMVEILKNL